MRLFTQGFQYIFLVLSWQEDIMFPPLSLVTSIYVMRFDKWNKYTKWSKRKKERRFMRLTDFSKDRYLRMISQEQIWMHGYKQNISIYLCAIISNLNQKKSITIFFFFHFCPCLSFKNVLNLKDIVLKQNKTFLFFVKCQHKTGPSFSCSIHKRYDVVICKI